MEATARCTELMDFAVCWSDWRNELKRSLAESRTYYQDETVQLFMTKLEEFLNKKVCTSSPEEELLDAMWEAADTSERQTLATLLLKIADRV